MPEVEDLKRVEQIIAMSPEDVFTDEQKATFATGWDLPPFREAGFTKDDYFTWLADPDTGTLKDKLFNLRVTMLKQKQLNHVQEHGWSVMGVMSDDEQPSFGYTVGFTALKGYELVVVNGNPNTLGAIINTVCSELKTDNLTVGSVFTLPEFTVKGKGDLRAKLVDIDFDSPTAKQVTGRVDGIVVTQIKQLLLGDANNLLPDEDGHDPLYIQTLTD